MPRTSATSMAVGAMLAAALTVASVIDAQAELTNAPPPKETVPVRADTFARGLEHPWALQFLGDGTMLVTERPGRMRLVTSDGKLSPPIAGVPPVFAVNQGGLLDVVLDPDFATSGLIHFCYAEPRGDRTAASTVAWARLIRDGAGGRLENVKVLFRQESPARGGLQFGCRLAFATDGKLFIALGDLYEMQSAQDLSSARGKIVRIAIDGSIPPDNPFVGRPGVRPEIWTLGHRNPQAATLDPASGKLWAVEHGPRGGDEVNVIERGRNYGWPVIGYGIDYSGAKIHDRTAKEGMEQPVYYWRPSIAPSGGAFYAGNLIPGWQGNLLVGALAGKALHRLVLDEGKVVAEEKLLKDLGERIRDVRVGPDGAVWLLTDNPEGRILRVAPQK